MVENIDELYMRGREAFDKEDYKEAERCFLEVVKARLHRGKARLKKELLNACQFSRDERNELTCDPKKMPPDKSKPQSH